MHSNGNCCICYGSVIYCKNYIRMLHEQFAQKFAACVSWMKPFECIQNVIFNISAQSIHEHFQMSKMYQHQGQK